MEWTYEVDAPQGKADALVVFLHGYGSDGKDLITLGRQWRGVMPNVCFMAPNGPQPCEQFPSGYQWTSMKDWDPARIVGELRDLRGSLNRFLDDTLKKLELTPDRLALVGFSQGVFVALDIALHRLPCAGVVGYSGGLFEDPLSIKVAKPPILLVHGEDDTVVSPQASLAAAETLSGWGAPVEVEILPGLEHGIDERGLGMGAAFLKTMLYDEAHTDHSHHHHVS